MGEKAIRSHGEIQILSCLTLPISALTMNYWVEVEKYKNSEKDMGETSEGLC